MQSSTFDYLKKIACDKYLFWATLIFYLILLFVNPSNYIIAGSFGFLFLLFFLVTKEFSWSLVLTFIASIIVNTGKDYPIQLLSARVFPVEIFPQGYFIHLVITPSHIISFLMVIFIIREILSQNFSIAKFKINKAELLLILFFALKFFSAISASKEPQLSLASELLSMNGFVLYFYIKLVVKKVDQAHLKQLIYLLAALVAFESILAFFQIITQSPLYKNLEFQVNIEYFGHAIDEPQFTFRSVGTFDHANTLGIWLASELTLLAVFITEYKSNIIWVTFLLGIAALITTLSRSAWLGFFFGIIFLIILLRKFLPVVLTKILNKVWQWRFLLVLTILFSLFVFILPRAEKSLYSFEPTAGAVFYRETLIQEALEIIKLHPILGVGSLMGVYEGLSLNLYSAAASIPLVVHNWYISLAMENGLPALFSFIFFLIPSLRSLWAYFKKPPVILLGLTSVVVCLSLSSIFQPYVNVELILLLVAFTNRDII